MWLQEELGRLKVLSSVISLLFSHTRSTSSKLLQTGDADFQAEFAQLDHCLLCKYKRKRSSSYF